MRTPVSPPFLVVSVVLAACVAVAGDADAQANRAGARVCGDEGGVALSGSLVPLDSLELPLLSGSMTLRSAGGEDADTLRCSLHEPEEGTFSFRQLKPGDYELELHLHAVRAPRSVPVSVGESDVELLVPVEPSNEVADCLEEPRCVRILSTRTTTELEAEAPDALTLFVYRLTLALAHGTWTQDEPWVACVPDERHRVRASLSEVHDHVAPASECDLPGRDARVQVHEPSGRDARILRLDSIEEREGAGRYEIEVSSFVGVRWATGWRCRVERIDGGFLARSCVVTWMS